MNMKTSNILLATSIIVLGILGYVVYGAFELVGISHSFAVANIETHEASGLVTESFYTQLELWEYAYDPNEERLSAFLEHRASFDEKLARVTLLTETKDAAFAGGRAEIEEITQLLHDLNGHWSDLIAIAKRGDAAALRKQAFKTEQAFDDADFDAKLDHFAAHQASYSDDLHEMLMDKVITIRILCVILTVAYLVLLSTLFFWIKSVVMKLELKNKKK